MPSQPSYDFLLAPRPLSFDPAASDLSIASASASVSSTSSFHHHLLQYDWCQPVIAIAIEDEDLMFGGKSLSAWHEEDRSRLGAASDEQQQQQQQQHQQQQQQQQHQQQQRRGRQRQRRQSLKKKSMAEHK